MNKFKDLCKSGYWLWKETNLPKRTIYDLYQGHAEFKYVRVHNALKISKSAEKMPTHLPMVITAFDAPAFFEPFVLMSKPFILAIIYDGLTLPTTYPPSTHSSSSTVFTFQMSCHGHFTMSMTGCQVDFFPK